MKKTQNRKAITNSFPIIFKILKKILNLFLSERAFENLKHILRYHGFYKPIYFSEESLDNFTLGHSHSKKNYKQEATDFFKNEINMAKIYLEYGSGKTTLLAKKLEKDFYSIESDKNFYKYLKKKLNNSDRLILKDFGYTYYWSFPINFEKKKEKLHKVANSYSNDILKELEKKNKIPDLILVDGRYRVLVGLRLYNFFKDKKNKFKIIFDDLNSKREYYNILHDYFEIKIISGRIGLAQKIKINNNIEDDIHKYSLDCR